MDGFEEVVGSDLYSEGTALTAVKGTDLETPVRRGPGGDDGGAGGKLLIDCSSLTP